MIPVFERAKIVHALDRAATVVGGLQLENPNQNLSIPKKSCLLDPVPNINIKIAKPQEVKSNEGVQVNLHTF
jgi:hypothetical protein